MKVQPNMLLIMTDQMRGDSMSCEQHPAVMTPNIDMLAATGTRFTRAYTTCPSCIAARRSLLTGMYPARNGMVGFQDGCPITTPTLPQIAAEGGYETALFGRDMHQYPYEELYGYQTRVHGTTYREDDDYARALEAAYPGRGGVKGHGISYNGWTAKPWHFPEYFHPTNWTVQKSRDYIARHSAEKPLFITTSFYAPHPPFIPPAFYLERYLRMLLPPVSIGDWVAEPASEYAARGIDAAHTRLAGEQLRTAQAGYYALINHVDDQVYWLITDFITISRTAGRPWLIVFTSDHGEMLGDHCFFRKCEPYEGSARIPFIICGSTDLGLAQGQVCRQVVCLEDILPTLLAVADLDTPADIDGKSLLGILNGEDRPVREFLHSEHSPCYSNEQAHHMLTDGVFKYIWRPGDGTEQLFNLSTDPRELHDLARDGQWAELLSGWRTTMIQELANRPEGFSDGKSLKAGCEYRAFIGC